MALAVFDIGGTAVKYGIWSDDQIEQQDKFQTPDNWEQMKVELSRIFNALQEKTTEKFSGAAFSCPGAVDSEAGVINGFSAVPYIHNIPIQTEL
ncbi:MAG: ROK family protein, partial [Lactobacillales bacterium]|nr:ROK family protein [Lactobacillales bacterium]